MATGVQRTSSSPVERDSHLLVRAHVIIILTSVGYSDQERIIGKTLVALARGCLEVPTRQDSV